jgi:large subunit ribosomal protein L30
MAKMLKVTQVKSIIDCKKDQKETIFALKLGRPNYYALHKDNPQIRGMINKVKHLLKVEQIEVTD